MAIKEEGHIYCNFKDTKDTITEKILQVFKIYLKNTTITTINNNITKKADEEPSQIH